MKLAKSMLVAAGLALAVGGAYAAGDKPAKQAKADAEPGFNTMDKNNDGKLTRSEAAKDKSLLGKWKDADRDSDGSLSRAEYLMVKGKKDAGMVADKVRSAVSKDDKASAGGTSTPKSK